MDEQEVVSLLKQVKPLGTKLAQAGYDYIFDAADLAYIPIHEQIKAYLLGVSDDAKGQAVYEQGGLTAQEAHWLMAFYVIRDAFQDQAGQPGTEEPFQPFRERLVRLENDWQGDMAFGEVSLWSDLDLHVLVDLARSDPLYLFAAEKKLARMQAEILGDPLPDYTPLEMGILFNFYQQVQTDGLLSLILPDTRAPSEVTDTEWLLAMRKPGHFPDYGKAGEWMIFPTRLEVDVLWQHISEATREGRLGPLSKVSTAKPMKVPHKHEHVIQIYTDDREDQGDVSRVRDVLRALGVSQYIPYGPVKRSG